MSYFMAYILIGYLIIAILTTKHDRTRMLAWLVLWIALMPVTEVWEHSAQFIWGYLILDYIYDRFARSQLKREKQNG